MKVTFTMDKSTKNTIRFAESLKDELASPKIGTLYVPKATLNEIGWKIGQDLVIELGPEEESGNE